MAGPNILVLLLEGGAPEVAQRALDARGVTGATVQVVAPASVSPLQWLTSDEDKARRDADHRAVDAAGTLTEQRKADGAVEVESGDTDPVQAVEDALRTFPADEIMIVGGADDAALELALRELGRPVTRLGANDPPAAADSTRRDADRVVQGRSQATPFALFGPVVLIVAAVVIVVVVLAVLAIWIF